MPGLVEFVEANEPRVIAFNEYVNDAGDEVSVVQIHPDAASMEAHIAVIAERARAAYAETLDATVRIQVFGQPSEEMLVALKQQAGEGVEIALHTEHLGGFTAPPTRTRAAASAKLTPLGSVAHRRVGHERADLLRTAAGGGDLRGPLQGRLP